MRCFFKGLLTSNQRLYLIFALLIASQTVSASLFNGLHNLTGMYIHGDKNATGYPEIDLSANELDFGYLGIRATRTLIIEISNTGTTDLEIESIDVENSLFSVSIDALTLPSQTSQQCRVTFISSTVGVYADMLKIKSNAAVNQDITIPLTAKVIDLNVTLMIKTEAGMPIPGAEVVISKNDLVIATGITEGNGEAVFNELYSGFFNFKITKNEFETSSGTFAVGQSSVIIPITVTYLPSLLFWAGDLIDWQNEPEHASIKGYHNNPYDEKRKYFTAYKLCGDYYDNFTQESFDFLWEASGNAQNIDRFISGSYIFNFGNPFILGAQWKAVHNGSKLFVLLKMTDSDQIASYGSGYFEVSTQPGEIVRHEPTFSFGMENDLLIMQNMAYGRFIELGGGTTLMWNNTPFDFGGIAGLTGNWETNQPNSAGLRRESHFWNETDGIISAILVMDFAQSLSSPVDPIDIGGGRIAMEEDRTLSFDVKFTTLFDNVLTEYYWSSESRHCNTSNYYSGHLFISPEDLKATPKVLTIVSNPAEGGTAAGEGIFAWGDLATISATPNEGWKFVNWTRNGTPVSKSNPFTFPVYHNTDITAIFTNKWPTLAVNPQSIDTEIKSGQSAELNIEIANNGNSPLNYSIAIEITDPDKKINSGQGYFKQKDKTNDKDSFDNSGFETTSDKVFGGPDGFGYVWVDSEDSRGPVFAWNSIESTGELLTVVSECDDCIETLDLPFDFTYYDIKYKKLHVNANGYIHFVSTWSSYSNMPLPSVNAPAGMIAGFWTDLCPRCSNNGKIFFQKFENFVIIQYHDVPILNGDGAVTFQIQLHRTGEIIFLYQNIPQAMTEYTVGIQNHNQQKGLQIAYNTPFLKNSYALKIASSNWISTLPKAGIIAPGENQNIKINLNATWLTNGIYNAIINILSNDPDKPLVQLPVLVNVSSCPAIELSHQSVDFGIWGVGHQHQFSLKFTNTGGAPLVITNIETDNDVFSVPLTEMAVAPFESETFNIGFFANEEAIFDGNLTFNTNVTGAETFTIPLKARTLRLDALFLINHMGDPVQNASVVINQGYKMIFAGNTNETGSLLTDNLFPGTFSYVIFKDGFANAEGTIVISNQSIEITVSLTELFLKLSILSNETTFETGFNEIIPLRIDTKGFSEVYYSLYLMRDEYTNFITSGTINPANSTSITYDYHIDPFLVTGSYNFLIQYFGIYPYYGGQSQTHAIEIINNQELIEVITPDYYNTYYAGSTVFISWKSINTSSVDIFYSIDDELTWNLIASNVSTSDSYDFYSSNNYQWNLAPDFVDKQVPCKILIKSSTNDNVQALSNTFLLKGVALQILFPLQTTQIYQGEKLDLVIDVSSPAFLYFNVLDELSNMYLEFWPEYAATGIQTFHFTQTQNLKPGKNRLRIYHTEANVFYYSEFFDVLPAGELHLVNFNLEGMANAILSENTPFDPELHDVYISGTFQENWPKPGISDRYKMVRKSNGNYIISLNTPPGEILYGFFIVPKSGEPTWENGESDTANCRIAKISSPTELSHTWMSFPEFELMLQVNPPGAGQVFGGGLRPSGHFTFINAIANIDYKFINWTTSHQQVLSESPHTELRMPPGNVTYTANFMYQVNAGIADHSPILLYPNPARDKIRLVTTGIISEIRIIDYLGRIVISRTGQAENEIEIDVSSLNPGVYIVRLVDDSKVNYLKLQVIQ